MLKYFYTLLIICLCKLYISEQSIIVIDRDLLSIPKPINPIEKHKVIIVGAGVSGLSAATLLLQQNFSDILILEASSQIGGRISTVKFGDSLIDFGAQWVLGGKGNPVYELSKPYDVLVQDDVDDNYDFRTTPTSGVNMTQFYELYELLYTIFDDKTAINGSKGSLADFFNNRFENIVKKVGADRKTADAVRDLICKLQNAFIGSDNLNEAGILGFARYKDIDANFTCAWKTGYHTFIDIILRKYEGNNINTMVMNRIQFNKVVQNVDWNDNSVVLTCEDGSKYSADHVILTVSLGVLKHSAKFMFTPPLPSVKMDAIQSIGMGTVEKIFLKFPYSWWSEEEFDMSFIWTEEEKRQYRIHSNHGGWPTDILGFHYIQNEPTILQGWIVGESAREMENFSDEVVLAVCYDILSKFIPEIQIPEPTNITRTHWRSNRFFRGSYSFPTVESDVCNLSTADLAEPIYNHSNVPVLMFAGEATHNTFYATVHGALEAGWREALRVLKYQNITLKNISN